MWNIGAMKENGKLHFGAPVIPESDIAGGVFTLLVRRVHDFKRWREKGPGDIRCQEAMVYFHRGPRDSLHRITARIDRS